MFWFLFSLVFQLQGLHFAQIFNSKSRFQPPPVFAERLGYFSKQSLRRWRWVIKTTNSNTYEGRDQKQGDGGAANEYGKKFIWWNISSVCSLFWKSVWRLKMTLNCKYWDLNFHIHIIDLVRESKHLKLEQNNLTKVLNLTNKKSWITM